MSDAMTNHSDTESLAAFVDGRLGREEREAVTKHVQTCEECQGFVREAAAFEQEEEAAARKPGRTWWAAAAAVAVVLAVAPFVPGFHRWELKKDTQQLFAAIANGGERKIEARLSGQTPYARWAPKRGEPEDDDHQLKVAYFKLVDTADKDLSPEGRRAAALAETVTNPRNALAILNGIPEQARDAVIWNDIAGLRHHLGEEQAALAAVERALRLDPKMPEALFNRALILQRKGDRKAAREAWVQYVAADSFSPWADEVPRNIRRLVPPQ
ncbi:MAG: zf-HC2 domain-containing protein [Acidobacteriota bacterium]